MWTTLYRSTKYNNIYYKYFFKLYNISALVFVSVCFVLSKKSKDYIFFYYNFFINYLYFDRTVSRQEAQQREMGVGSGKVWESGLELRMPKVQQHYMSAGCLQRDQVFSFHFSFLCAWWNLFSKCVFYHHSSCTFFFLSEIKVYPTLLLCKLMAIFRIYAHIGLSFQHFWCDIPQCA